MVEKKEKRKRKRKKIITGIMMMNFLQPRFFIEYLDFIKPHSNTYLLDIGCGGGKFIKKLSKKYNINLFGIDPAEEMVNYSKKINSLSIKTGKVGIQRGTVSNLPYSDDMFHIITAFRTIPHWPDLEQGLKDVYRVLKHKGIFIIINRYPKKGTKWWKMLQADKDGNYTSILKKVGFNDTMADTYFKKGWIIVTAQKGED